MGMVTAWSFAGCRNCGAASTESTRAMPPGLLAVEAETDAARSGAWLGTATLVTILPLRVCRTLPRRLRMLVLLGTSTYGMLTLGLLITSVTSVTIPATVPSAPGANGNELGLVMSAVACG